MHHHEAALRSIKRKFGHAGLKVSGVVAKCQKLDRNADHSIHMDDLEEIIQRCLGEYKLTRRELNHLFALVTSDRRSGNVEYLRLHEVLEGKPKDDDEDQEHWFMDSSERSTFKRGSVGEYLETTSCPAEVANFRKFIAALETFERSSGMKVKPTEDGFMVPLGPDITVNIQFNLN